MLRFTCKMPKPCLDFKLPVAKKYSIEYVIGDSRLHASIKFTLNLLFFEEKF